MSMLKPWILNLILSERDTPDCITRTVKNLGFKSTSVDGDKVCLVTDGSIAITSSFLKSAVRKALAELDDTEADWSSALLILVSYKLQLKIPQEQGCRGGGAEYVLIVDRFKIWDLQRGNTLKKDVKLCMKCEPVMKKMEEDLNQRKEASETGGLSELLLHIPLSDTSLQLSCDVTCDMSMDCEDGSTAVSPTPPPAGLETSLQLSCDASMDPEESSTDVTPPPQRAGPGFQMPAQSNSEVQQLTDSLLQTLFQPFSIEEFQLPVSQLTPLDCIPEWQAGYKPQNSLHEANSELESQQHVSLCLDMPGCTSSESATINRDLFGKKCLPNLDVNGQRAMNLTSSSTRAEEENIGAEVLSSKSVSILHTNFMNISSLSDLSLNFTNTSTPHGEGSNSSAEFSFEKSTDGSIVSPSPEASVNGAGNRTQISIPPWSKLAQGCRPRPEADSSTAQKENDSLNFTCSQNLTFDDNYTMTMAHSTQNGRELKYIGRPVQNNSQTAEEISEHLDSQADGAKCTSELQLSSSRNVLDLNEDNLVSVSCDNKTEHIKTIASVISEDSRVEKLVKVVFAKKSQEQRNINKNSDQPLRQLGKEPSSMEQHLGRELGNIDQHGKEPINISHHQGNATSYTVHILHNKVTETGPNLTENQFSKTTQSLSKKQDETYVIERPVSVAHGHAVVANASSESSVLSELSCMSADDYTAVKLYYNQSPSESTQNRTESVVNTGTEISSTCQSSETSYPNSLSTNTVGSVRTVETQRSNETLGVSNKDSDLGSVDLNLTDLSDVNEEIVKEMDKIESSSELGKNQSMYTREVDTCNSNLIVHTENKVTLKSKAGNAFFDPEIGSNERSRKLRKKVERARSNSEKIEKKIASNWNEQFMDFAKKFDREKQSNKQSKSCFIDANNTKNVTSKQKEQKQNEAKYVQKSVEKESYHVVDDTYENVEAKQKQDTWEARTVGRLVTRLKRGKFEKLYYERIKVPTCTTSSSHKDNNTPACINPSDNTPASVNLSDNTSASLNPSDNTPASENPSDNTPASVNPSDNTPASVNPSDNTPASVNPSENTPACVNLSENTPSCVNPSDKTPANVNPSDNTPASVNPSENTPACVNLSENTPSCVNPSDKTPANVNPRKNKTDKVYELRGTNRQKKRKSPRQNQLKPNKENLNKQYFIYKGIQFKPCVVRLDSLNKIIERELQKLSKKEGENIDSADKVDKSVAESSKSLEVLSQEAFMKLMGMSQSQQERVQLQGYEQCDKETLYDKLSMHQLSGDHEKKENMENQDCTVNLLASNATDITHGKSVTSNFDNSEKSHIQNEMDILESKNNSGSRPTADLLVKAGCIVNSEVLSTQPFVPELVGTQEFSIHMDESVVDSRPGSPVIDILTMDFPALSNNDNTVFERSPTMPRLGLLGQDDMDINFNKALRSSPTMSMMDLYGQDGTDDIINTAWPRNGQAQARNHNVSKKGSCDKKSYDVFDHKNQPSAVTKESLDLVHENIKLPNSITDNVTLTSIVDNEAAYTATQITCEKHSNSRKDILTLNEIVDNEPAFVAIKITSEKSSNNRKDIVILNEILDNEPTYVATQITSEKHSNSRKDILTLNKIVDNEPAFVASKVTSETCVADSSETFYDDMDDEREDLKKNEQEQVELLNDEKDAVSSGSPVIPRQKTPSLKKVSPIRTDRLKCSWLDIKFPKSDTKYDKSTARPRQVVIVSSADSRSSCENKDTNEGSLCPPFWKELNDLEMRLSCLKRKRTLHPKQLSVSSFDSALACSDSKNKAIRRRMNPTSPVPLGNTNTISKLGQFFQNQYGKRVVNVGGLAVPTHSKDNVTQRTNNTEVGSKAPGKKRLTDCVCEEEFRQSSSPHQKRRNIYECDDSSS
ncbi:uncharacterized protein LOC127843625 [Dreissena polymorpha]|uniref:Uncharacterized protein n=1 Tax=Dreissena polymorpha TaxID=45954 RepID=A0A9D4EAH3_DREPO|nr:uncharacterized protein LOC127843625 [Dreissena polymorpha]KAH3776949.1 hypothetical protein DPMN_178383 [Dreissena polymorpha]